MSNNEHFPSADPKQITDVLVPLCPFHSSDAEAGNVATLEPGLECGFSGLHHTVPLYHGLSSTVRMGTGLETMVEQHKAKGSRATKAEQWQIKSC